MQRNQKVLRQTIELTLASELNPLRAEDANGESDLDETYLG